MLCPHICVWVSAAGVETGPLEDIRVPFQGWKGRQHTSCSPMGELQALPPSVSAPSAKQSG